MNTIFLKVTSIAFVLIFIYTQPAVPQNKPVFELRWDLHNFLDTNIVIRVHPTLPKYSLKITTNDSGASLAVLFRNRRIIDTVNVISLYDEYDHNWPPSSFFPQTILFGEDFNFDGYLDLAIISTEDDRGNPSYSIWLFNPKKHSFEENDEFTEHIYAEYTLDKYSKTITTSYVDYLYTEDYTTITYRLVQNKLYPILIESIEHFISHDTSSSYYYRWKLERVINNQPKLIKEMIFKSTDEIEQYFKKK